MKLPSFLPLAAALLHIPLLSAQDAPPPAQKTWEFHLRADGGGNDRLAELTRLLLSPVSRTIRLEEGASFHAAGFQNPVTPGKDWAAELRGTTNARKLIADAAEHGGLRFENDTLFLSKGKQTYALWASSDNVIRAVSPAENRDSSFIPSDDSTEAAWISGGAPISLLPDELPKSDLLKLLERVDFSVTGHGAEISAEVLAASITPEIAAKATAKARKLAAAATLISGEEIPIEALAKDLSITQTGDKLHIRFNLSQETLEKSLKGLQQFIRSARPR